MTQKRGMHTFLLFPFCMNRITASWDPGLALRKGTLAVYAYNYASSLILMFRKESLWHQSDQQFFPRLFEMHQKTINKNEFNIYLCIRIHWSFSLLRKVLFWWS